MSNATTYRDRFRALPEANGSFDAIDTLDRMVRDKAEAEALVVHIQGEIEAQRAKVIAALRKDWTDTEIKEAGFEI